MAYIPERGDAAWLSFDPQLGHEQQGRRPCIVLSPAAYNRKTGLALFCPVTNQTKGYSFEVALPEGSQVTGVILADQIKNLDWKARRIEFIARLPTSVTEEVLLKVSVLLNR